MKLVDAARVLGLSGTVDPEDVKRAYRTAAKRYHPDHNPAGAEMMKMVNAAYEALRDHVGPVPTYEPEGEKTYPDGVFEALSAIVELDGLFIEICGAWVWVTGATFKHRETLKGTHFRYARKKKSWYFRPEDWRSASRGTFSMDEIREKYGSDKMRSRDQRQIEEAVS